MRMTLALVLLTAACMTEPGEDFDQVQQETAGRALSTASLGRVAITDIEVDIVWRGVSSKLAAVGADGETVDFFMQEINFGPGGHTGWHQHPGPVVVLVTQGTLTYYAGTSPCVGEDFATGTGWIDSKSPASMLVKNNGTGNAQIRVVYFLPGGAAARIDIPTPAGGELCPP